MCEWRTMMAMDLTLPRYMQCSVCGLLSERGPFRHNLVRPDIEGDWPRCPGEWVPRYTVADIVWPKEN